MVPLYPSAAKTSGQGRPPTKRPHKEGWRVRRESWTVLPLKKEPSRVRSCRTHPSNQAQAPARYRVRIPASRGMDATKRRSNTSEGKVTIRKKTKQASVYHSQPVRDESKRSQKRLAWVKMSALTLVTHAGGSERRLPS